MTEGNNTPASPLHTQPHQPENASPDDSPATQQQPSSPFPLEQFAFGHDKHHAPPPVFDYQQQQQQQQQQHYQRAQSLSAGRTRSSWFADDPSKAYYEKFSLIWAPLSMFILLAVVLGTPIYKHCDRNMLLLITVVFCLPGVVIPVLWPCAADEHRPFGRRFWVKASVWIAIFDFFGNYFWTHYFYRLLGAQYLFDAHRFNDVPVVTFTATFFYFSFYFNFASVLLRRVDRAVADFPPFSRRLVWAVAVAALSYATAVFEAVSIQHFPLYTYTERNAFLTVGSVFYALYFVVGFPAFYALDEPDAAVVAKRVAAAAAATTTRAAAAGAGDSDDEQEEYDGEYIELDIMPCSTYDAAMGAFAATAIVTLLLDLWRLCLGSIYELGLPTAKSIPIPFIYQQDKAAAAAAAAAGGGADAGATALSNAAAAAGASCGPSPTPQIVIVERPVTIGTCASVAQKWALDRFPALRRAA